MCGLVGIFGEGFSKYKDLFEELLHIDQLRGPHSTGVAFLNKKYVSVVKAAVTPEELSYYKKYRKSISKDDHIGIMGHNRQATRGEINDANAHPFMHGRITLTHNGTLSNTNPLPKQFPTDSESICYAINEWGIEKTWDKLEYCNPGTLIFYDAKDKTLNMITNLARPIFFSYLKDKKAIIWASEDWMYRGVCARNNVELDKDEDGVSTYFLKKDRVYSFKYDETEKCIVLADKEIKFTKPYQQSTTYQNNYRSIDWHNNQGQSGAPFLGGRDTQSTEKNGTTSQKTDRVGPIARLDVAKFRKNLGGIARGLALHDFQDKFHYCVGCDESLLDEYHSCFILSDNDALCSDCISGFIALGVNPEKQLSVVN